MQKVEVNVSVPPPLEYLPPQPTFVKYHTYVPAISQNFGGKSQKQPLRTTLTGATNNKKILGIRYHGALALEIALGS